MIVVSKDNTGDFLSIKEAVLHIESSAGKGNEEREIFVKPGIYKERLEIKTDGITIRGESADNTVITYDLYANEILEDGFKRGTFRSYSVFIDADNFTAENITFENSAGLGSKVGQAIAVYAEGDNLLFRCCRLLASQDTLFTGPLPETVIEPRGFVGPKENAPRINGRQIYEHCFIKGDIDFIFGSSTAYFESCEIFSQNIGRDINGYVTAPSTPKDQKYGYVFESCKFTSDCPKNSVYLGRPWRNYAKAVFLNCEYGAHIMEEGFHDWDKKESHDTMFFAEYNCTQEGSEPQNRADFVKRLTKDEALEYTKERVLKNR